MTTTAWMDHRWYGTYSDHWDVTLLSQWIADRVTPETHVLDLGAGRGRLEQLNFRGKCKMIAGVDPDAAVLENPLLDEAQVQSPPDYRIPYEDATFDVVFSNSVLEHVADVSGFLNEVRRVLKPDGVLIAKTPNKIHYVALLARITPHWFHDYVNRMRGRQSEDTFPTLYRCNSRQQIQSELHAAGLQLARLEIIEGRPEYLRMNPLTYLAGFLYERFVNRFRILERFRCVILFEAKKPSAPG